MLIWNVAELPQIEVLNVLIVLILPMETAITRIFLTHSTSERRRCCGSHAYSNGLNGDILGLVVGLSANSRMNF
jgi:hypothetical protein